jgi:N-terminal domain of toast_rack, DUF2154/Cell wall-active antibiotics response LiaF, C-terminal
MSKQTRHIPALLVGLAALLGAALACSLPIQRTGQLQTKTETVERGAASSVDVEITMGAGELTVSGGAADLMDGEFTYNIDSWEPEVNYAVSGDQGRLTVRQPEVEISGIPDNDVRYTWDLQFTDETPLNMEINLGAGQSNIDLGTLSLGQLTMRSGAGDVTARLGGSQLSQADITAGVGKNILDLSGNWENDASIAVKAGIGDLTVIVPKDVGAIITVAVGLGDVNADGFRIQGDSYTNDAYGDSPVTLRVDIQRGVGQVTLEVGE